MKKNNKKSIFGLAAVFLAFLPHSGSAVLNGRSFTDNQGVLRDTNTGAAITDQGYAIDTNGRPVDVKYGENGGITDLNGNPVMLNNNGYVVPREQGANVINPFEENVLREQGADEIQNLHDLDQELNNKVNKILGSKNEEEEYAPREQGADMINASDLKELNNISKYDDNDEILEIRKANNGISDNRSESGSVVSDSLDLEKMKTITKEMQQIKDQISALREQILKIQKNPGISEKEKQEITSSLNSRITAFEEKLKTQNDTFEEKFKTQNESLKAEIAKAVNGQETIHKDHDGFTKSITELNEKFNTVSKTVDDKVAKKFEDERAGLITAATTGVEDKIKTLSQDINETSTKLVTNLFNTNKEELIKGAKTQLAEEAKNLNEKANETLQKAQLEVPELKKKIGDGLEGLKGDITSLEAKLTQDSQKFKEDLEKETTNRTASFGSLQEDLTAVKASLVKTNKEAEEAKNLVVSEGAQRAQIQDQVNQLKAATTEDQLKKTVGIATMESSIDRVKNKLALLEEDVITSDKSLSKKVNTLETSLATLKPEELEALSQKIPTMETSISNLKTKLDTLNPEELENKIKEINKLGVDKIEKLGALSADKIQEIIDLNPGELKGGVRQITMLDGDQLETLDQISKMGAQKAQALGRLDVETLAQITKMGAQKAQALGTLDVQKISEINGLKKDALKNGIERINSLDDTQMATLKAITKMSAEKASALNGFSAENIKELGKLTSGSIKSLGTLNPLEIGKIKTLTTSATIKSLEELNPEDISKIKNLIKDERNVQSLTATVAKLTSSLEDAKKLSEKQATDIAARDKEIKERDTKLAAMDDRIKALEALIKSNDPQKLKEDVVNAVSQAVEQPLQKVSESLQNVAQNLGQFENIAAAQTGSKQEGGKK